ncbi:MAG: hypothetical protein EOO43_20895 [Flavobacterium sp.]|nr:MAG: hypothetical protein EOO43_20895 [Flavobacterium sp.]
MMNKPTIAILLATYNGVKYISAQIESILRRFGVLQQGAANTTSPLQRYQQRLLDVRAALQAYVQDPRGSDKVLQLVQEAQYETQDLL